MVLNFGFRAFENNKNLKSRPSVYSSQRLEDTAACGHRAAKHLNIRLRQAQVQKSLELNVMINC